MPDKKICIRVDESFASMLQDLELLEAKNAKELNVTPRTKTDIIRTALKEYYAKQMDTGTSNAYLSLVSSTLDALLAKYMNLLRDDFYKTIKKSEKNTAEKVDFTNMAAMIMFGWFSQAMNDGDDLPLEQLQQNLKVIEKNGYSDVFQSYVSEQVEKMEEE